MWNGNWKFITKSKSILFVFNNLFRSKLNIHKLLQNRNVDIRPYFVDKKHNKCCCISGGPSNVEEGQLEIRWRYSNGHYVTITIMNWFMDFSASETNSEFKSTKKLLFCNICMSVYIQFILSLKISTSNRKLKEI